jgi:uncharacterized membrane protein YfcA
MQTTAMVAISAFFAAAVSAVAGGGTFVAFPVLTGVAGLTEKAATVACNIGLFPGLVSAVAAVWREYARLPRTMALWYTFAALSGGFAGAELLIHTSDRAFSYAIPWLLLIATATFALGEPISRWARRESAVLERKGESSLWRASIGWMLFLLSIYGGYFGAGMGVMTLAGLSLVGLRDLRQVNVFKMLLVTACNVTAALVFVGGPVRWDLVVPMAVASTLGGFLAMRAAQRLSQVWLRRVILTTGSLLTAGYFWKVYLST